MYIYMYIYLYIYAIILILNNSYANNFILILNNFVMIFQTLTNLLMRVQSSMMAKEMR